jgi:isocitrate dehydrogenase kinase/phosphatase
MTPLNEYLAQAAPEKRKKVINDYASAIRDLAGANIFPGDMMQKNFGVTRLERVVFYDYDEIDYMTECNFRRLPQTNDYFDDLSEQPVYSIQDHDVFPESFPAFFCPNPEQREVFMRDNADLVGTEFWRETQASIREGRQGNVYPYPLKQRFSHRYGGRPAPLLEN